MTGERRDWEGEYNALSRALIGDTGASAIMEAGRHRQCIEALMQVRAAILNADPAVLTDTLWVSDIETAVDCIDIALEFKP